MQLIEKESSCLEPISGGFCDKGIIRNVSLSELKNDAHVIRLIQRWVDYWDLPTFNHILKTYIETECSQEKANDLIIFLHLDNQQHLMSVLIFQYLKVDLFSSSPAKLFLNWIINPIDLQKRPQDFADFITKYLVKTIQNKILPSMNIIRSSIAFFFFEIPQTTLTMKFVDLFSVNNKSNPQSSNSNAWIRYTYPCDQLIKAPDGSKFYRNTYHFLCYNAEFDPQPPKAILRKMQGALKILLEYEAGLNPFNSDLDKNSHQIFKEILEEKKRYLRYFPEINRKIDYIRKQRKKIWWRFSLMPPRNHQNYAELFANCSSKNLKLIYDQGFRVNIFKVESEEGNRIIQRYLPALALATFETINSEGSLYARITKEDGSLNPEFYSIEFFKEVFGEYAAFLEYCSESGEYLFAGWSQISFKKPCPPYTSQMFASLIFPKIFRGAALAQILTAFSIVLVEKHNIFDFIIEDNTDRNLRTSKLVDRLGFHSYGLLERMFYDITGLSNRNIPINVGFFRRYRFSITCVEKLLQHTPNLKSSQKLRQDHAMHAAISKATDQLIEEGLLKPLKNL